MFFITLKPSVTDSALFHRQIEFVVLFLNFFFSYKKKKLTGLREKNEISRTRILLGKKGSNPFNAAGPSSPQDAKAA